MFGVTASIPCFGANRYVRRAVESLLAQTHKDLTIVVVNDGSSEPPWGELAELSDPRLVRFNLEQNRGPYFAHQVVLAASDTPYFLIQDADDWSSPNRVSTLLDQLLADDSDFAFSASQQYREDDHGALRPDSIRWRRKDAHVASKFLFRDALTAAGITKKQKAPKLSPFVFEPILTDEFINRASHHGVFRREALERIGGYYGGFRINYDTLLTNLLLMTAKVSFVEVPLYHYVIRGDSLSNSVATGARSSTRTYIRAKQTAIYNEAMHWYRQWKKQAITTEEFLTLIRDLATCFVTGVDAAALAVESARLAEIIRSLRARTDEALRQLNCGYPDR